MLLYMRDQRSTAAEAASSSYPDETSADLEPGGTAPPALRGTRGGVGAPSEASDI